MIRIEGIRLVATRLAAAQNDMSAKATSRKIRRIAKVARGGQIAPRMNAFKAPQNDLKADTVRRQLVEL
jgi:hypothetical protein